ncbi:MAG: hypothetical protein ACLU94_02830 [Catenibacillus sp.]
MGENVNISKVIEFYSNITEENYKERFPVTYKFLNENPGSGPYYKLAELFVSDGRNVTDDPYDLKFYEHLKMLNLRDRYIFKADELVAKVAVFEPFVDKEKTIVSQKWHLLISLYAYLDFVNNKFKFEDSKIYKKNRKDGINFEEIITGTEKNWNLIKGTGYHYDALKLWMAEAAGVENVHQYIHLENKKGWQVEIKWGIVEDKIRCNYKQI